MIMNLNRHFYLYAKGHYEMTDMVEDLSVIYRTIYMWPKETPVPIIYLIDVLQKLAILHIQKNPILFQEFLNDILPENTWRHGYITNDINYLIKQNTDNTENKPYNVKLAIISKLLSILRLTSVKEIPFELGKPDDTILPSKNIHEKEPNATITV